MAKVYNAASIREHNTKDDCWVVIEGKVYDVTTFLDDHPGGEEPLLSVTGGKDASLEFQIAGHGEEARSLMEKYYIGEVAEGEKLVAEWENHPPIDAKKGRSRTEYFVQFLIPFVLLNLVAVYLSKLRG